MIAVPMIAVTMSTVTVSAVLTYGWGLLVIALGFVLRPRSVRPLVLEQEPEAGADAERKPLLERAGRAGLRMLRRPEDPVRARQLGGIVLVGLPLAAVDLRLGVIASLAVWVRPAMAGRRARTKHHDDVLRELPEVVDLLSVAVAGGLTVSLAVAAVAERVPGLVAAQFERCVASASLGRRLADELEQIPEHLGDASRPLIRALVAAERYGTPVVEALAQVSSDVRTERRRQAEIAARRLPVKLLFPLVACVLPAFVLLTVVPILAGSVQGLSS